MIVTRKNRIAIPVKNMQIGDQINVELNGLGDFTATAQKVTDENVAFLFDDCITERPMNSSSDIQKWLDDDLRWKFPEELTPRLRRISLPTYGMIFGHDYFYENFLKPDDDEQFPLMNNARNRMAFYEDASAWYWLFNEHKNDASVFARMSSYGFATYGFVTDCIGIRPYFVLAK